MPKPLGAIPPYALNFQAILFSKEVQAVLRQAWDWDNDDPALGSYLYYAFEDARSFAERPTKYFHDCAWAHVEGQDWGSKSWFFSLCAAVCAVYANPSVEDRVTDAFATGVPLGGWSIGVRRKWRRATVKEVAGYVHANHAMNIAPGQISVIISRTRKGRAKIIKEWDRRFPEFFHPRPRAEVEYLR